MPEYLDLPISVVSYLKTAENIYVYFAYHHNGAYSSKLLKSIIEEINKNEDLKKEILIPLSLFMALFYYQTASDEDEMIKDNLKKIGLVKHKLENLLFCDVILNFFISSYDDKVIKKYFTNHQSLIEQDDEFMLKSLFQKYYTSGYLADKKEVTTLGILHNLFDRSFTKNLIIERLLDECGVTIDAVYKVLEEMTKINLEKESNAFYQNLSPKVCQFLNLAGLIYHFLAKQNLSEDNKKMLSLVIAAFSFAGSFKDLCLEKDLTLEKIYQRFNILVPYHFINNQTLSDDIFVFNKEVYEGINSQKDSQDISINDIIVNCLCNQNIDHFILINLHIKDQLMAELKRKELEKQEYIFKDKNQELCSFIHLLAVSYTSLYYQHDNQNQDLRLLALLVSLKQNANFYYYFVKDQNEKDDVNEMIEEADYYLLEKGYLQEINNSKDLLSFIQNVLSKYNPSVIKKICLKVNLDFNKIININVEYPKYQQYCWDKEYFDSFSDEIKSFITEVFQLMQSLLSNQHDLPNNIADLRVIAIIMTYLKDIGSHDPYFKKYHLDYDTLRKKLLSDVNRNNQEIDYSLMKKIFADYFNNKTISIFSLVKQVFQEKSSLLKDIVQDNNEDYDLFVHEFTEERMYTKAEIVALRTKEVHEHDVEPIMDIDDLESLQHFGDQLTRHTRYLTMTLPDTLIEQESSQTLISVKDLIDQLYTNNNRNFWQIVMKQKRLNLTPEVINNLRLEMQKQISILQDELLYADKVREYLETYYRKNKEYLEEALRVCQELEKALQDGEEKEFSRQIRLKSRLQIMNSRRERFSTTDHIITTELVEINQIITNHAILINLLEMSLHDLLPLIGTKLMVEKGINSEQQALRLSQNILELFRSMLDHNVSGINQSLSLMKSLNINGEVVDQINLDVGHYLDGFSKLKK